MDSEETLWSKYDALKLQMANLMNQALAEHGQRLYDEMLEDLQVFAAK